MNLRIKRKHYILASVITGWYLVSSLLTFVIFPPYTLENFGNAMTMALGISTSQIIYHLYCVFKTKRIGRIRG